MSSPFEYPQAPLIRRHEPLGYEWAKSFKPWLRDEFCFRCVFCLVRETWMSNELEVEHFQAVAKTPEAELEYTNLLYACRACNSTKGSRTVPDPTVELLRDEIGVDEIGVLHANSHRARELILVLGLNEPRMQSFRLLWIRIVKIAKDNDPLLHRRLMGYPDDLPDLSTLRPPGGNNKPDGIESSFFARRNRGELTEAY